MKILLVEDDTTLGAQLAAALDDAGFLTEVAGDGAAAEFLGGTETYVAAILDLGLPGLGGIEILGRWRGAGIDMPVLILTARGDWTDKIAGFRAGAENYVVKPAPRGGGGAAHPDHPAPRRWPCAGYDSAADRDCMPGKALGAHIPAIAGTTRGPSC